MKLVSLLLVLIALGGCSSDAPPEWAGKSGNIEPVKLTEFTESAKFAVRWQASAGDSGANLLSPALTKDAVYGVSYKGRLTRFERSTGKQIWRIDSGISVSGGVGSGDGLVFIGGEKGDVLAYGEDGKLRWKRKVSSEVLSVSQVADGVLLVRSGDGRIVGLKTGDGERLWSYERVTPALVVRSHAGVVIQRGVAYAGFAAGKLAAINIKDGTVLWETVVSQPGGNTELERISDITSDPVVDDEQVCAISFQGRVACFELAQGSPIWNRDISSDKGLMLLRKFLYFSDAKGSVYALDKTTGSTTWKNDQLFMRDVGEPYATDTLVVVGDFEGYLHGLSRDDGRLAARIKLGGDGINTAPFPMDNGLLVQTRSGDIYSLSIK
jgi:outer membrane protein assembly factor BamB